MRNALMLTAMLLFAAACKVEKTGDDTYSVTAPTPEAEAAARKAKEEAKEAGQVIREKAGEGAEVVGGKLQEAGRRAQSGTSPTSTTATTATSGTTSTTTTRKTSTY
ncbi:MAG TPA: hypothetical protein VNL91_07440 [Thermoanaerobaculia bacterium]|nr:hypothetical protein [Thermoanaerobaculia bacterium]